MNRGVTTGTSGEFGVVHAVAHQSVPAPGRSTRWFSLCDWENAELIEGRFEPGTASSCPACEDVLADDRSRVGPEGATVAA